MLLASSNLVSCEILRLMHGILTVLSAPCWCQSSGRGCSHHLLGFRFGMAFTGCVIWSVFSFGCPILLCVSPMWKHGGLKEAKALSQPQPDSEAQPRGHRASPVAGTDLVKEVADDCTGREVVALCSEAETQDCPWQGSGICGLIFVQPKTFSHCAFRSVESVSCLMYYRSSRDLNRVEAAGKLLVQPVRGFLHFLHFKRNTGARPACLV